MPNWKSYDSSVRLLSAILAAHPELKLNYQEISRRFGGDCTISALDNRFRRIKADAKLLNDALAQGIDPITITTDSLNGKVGGAKEISKYYGEGCTPSSLDHRFRPIKKDAQAMREEHGIAEKYGEECTAKAVSTRFERLKKEPSWITNGTSGSNSATNGTGNGTPKKPATPRKKKAAPSEGDNNGDDDEDFSTDKKTPKKSSLNKTQGGRVSKPKTPSKDNSFAMMPIEVASDDESNLIKTEPTTNGHVNGHDSSHMDVEEDEDGGHFYETNDGYISDADQV